MGKKKRKRKSRTPPAKRPQACSLALCMIVKDEEQMLPDCLASVRGLVEQVVVVDTGSSDRTVALAEAAGAQVVSFPWCDDFAAARNAALPRVETDWILMLDADERLAPGAAAGIRKAIADGGLDCGFLPLLDAEKLDSRPEDVLAGTARKGAPLLLPRLFRVSKDFRWEGIVHESISTWLSGDKKTGRVDAPIIHLGNVDSFRQERGKGERNLRLLRKRVDQEPDSAVARSYLAREL
ncbi:MAG: glycosyltransferase family 2 protein, partial [Myxococcota bacterium]|nr:glycosyltransferase family 2 protein [Myxococcota bacterium]